MQRKYYVMAGKRVWASTCWDSIPTIVIQLLRPWEVFYPLYLLIYRLHNTLPTLGAPPLYHNSFLCP